MPVAIITGGAAGIGRHLCAGFAREGYVVAALDIQPMSSPHPDIHCFPCDLRDEAPSPLFFMPSPRRSALPASSSTTGPSARDGYRWTTTTA